MPWDDTYARTRVARTEELLAGLDTLPDSAAAARAHEACEALVALYGECLARIMSLAASGAQDGGLPRRLTDDEVVGHLLLVHDLHPDPAATRVREALEEVSSSLRAHGTGLEILEVSESAVRVRLEGGRGCSSSAGELEQTVRDAVAARAPEAPPVEVETTAPAPAPQTLIPVDALFQGVRGAGRPLAGREAG